MQKYTAFSIPSLKQQNKKMYNLKQGLSSKTINTLIPALSDTRTIKLSELPVILVPGRKISVQLLAWNLGILSWEFHPLYISNIYMHLQKMCQSGKNSLIFVRFCYNYNKIMYNVKLTHIASLGMMIK